MHLEKHLICGIHITDRLQNAIKIQELLTECGGYIKTRLGLHDVGEDFSSLHGLILLEFVEGEAKFVEFTEKMNAIEGVEVQKMVFEHP
ncbi:hypothetical protein CSA56_14490 [candidate division KSB3 bacterium]|uniref:Iron-only hydrogenase system regulator n=1 Tax=candidate division KSB3 bacterium TaxID=2044937 RepID=A0A2G6KAK5_9BACT|nr:MAG: hypothetical protein CSA56_14490 [candidate division KSB3 bacterium]